MLDACTKAGDAPRGESWLQRMLEVGVQPNVISFATVIHAFARKGDEKKAKHWQNKMLEMGVKPVIWQQVAVLTQKWGCWRKSVQKSEFGCLLSQRHASDVGHVLEFHHAMDNLRTLSVTIP